MSITTATVSPQPSIDNYWFLVKHLSKDAKIDLITLLTQSLKQSAPHQVSARKYYGIWGDDGLTDEEFISELKSLRTLNHDIVEL